jgi:hypothetical protein
MTKLAANVKMDLIVGSMSSDPTVVPGQKVLLSITITYGLGQRQVDYATFAQVDVTDVPHLIFSPVIDVDITTFEWEITRQVGILAFPFYLFRKDVVTNQGRFSYYIVPDNTFLANPMLTLGKTETLNINTFQGFRFFSYSDKFDDPSGFISGLPLRMMSVAASSKVITTVPAAIIWSPVKGQLPKSFTDVGIYDVTSPFYVYPSACYNRNNCSLSVPSVQVIANYVNGTLPQWCKAAGFTECNFYVLPSMCSSGKTFRTCSKGEKCGTSNCFGGCSQDFQCLYVNDEVQCVEKKPPKPNPPLPPDPATIAFYLAIAGGVVFVIVVIIVIYSLREGAEKPK